MTMPMPWTMRPTAALAVLWGTVALAQAQTPVPVTPASITGVGLMSATCASLSGNGNGLSIVQAIDSGLQAAGTQCTGNLANTLAGSASSTASFANAQAQAWAGATASAGLLHVGATLDTPGSLAVSRFPIGIAQAGFADTLTVNLAGHLGEAGYLLVDVHVSGVLDATRGAGSASFAVAAAKNNQLLLRSNPGYDVGTGDSGTDRQQPRWSVATFPPPNVPGSPATAQQVVDETVTFSVPVTFGTSFELAVLGLATAGTRNQSGASLASSDFDHTVRWMGVQGVLSAGGQAVQGYSLASASGIDWQQAAVVPEPGSALLFMAGAAGLLWRRRAGLSAAAAG